MEKNTFIIGGSPSTGSSLLRQILNRSTKMRCLPETHLFAKPALYSDWNANKHRINYPSSLGIPSSGLHIVVGTLLKELHPDERLEFNKAIKDSYSIEEFVANLTQQFGTTIIGEKTPANALNFSDYLNAVPHGVVIHLVRNPYDTVASLIGRGHSPLMACLYYLLNTGTGIHHHTSDRYYQLSYESLILETKKTVEALSSYLSVPYEEHMLESNHTEADLETTKLKGWKYDETESIGSGSIGRFGELPEATRMEVCGIFGAIALKDGTTIKTVCEQLNYEHLPGDPLLNKVRSALGLFKWKLIFSNSIYNSDNFPFVIHE